MKSFRRMIGAFICVIVFAVSANAEQPTITLTSRLWSRPLIQNFLRDEIFAPFEEHHHCRVQFNYQDDDALFEAMRVERENVRIETDIVVAYCAAMRDLMEANYIEDITDTLAAWTPRTFPAALNAMTVFDERQYFMPVGADVYLLIANINALPYLPQNARLESLTWEQVAEWALAIAAGEGAGKFALTAAPQKMFIYQHGGMSLAYGAGFPQINSPEAVQAWKLLLTMKAALTPESLRYASVIEPMKRQDAWLAFAHCARVGEVYQSNPAQFVVVPAPAGPAGMGSIAGTSGYGLVKGAPQKELALKLLEYLTRPEIQLKIAKGATGFIPPVEESLQLLTDSPEDEIIRKALNVMDKGNLVFIPSDFGAKWGDVKQLYDNALRKMVFEDGAIEQDYLDALQEEIDTLEVEGLLLKTTR